MTLTNPEVTVIIPVLNEEKYIKGCLDSLLRQTFPLERTECLIIDGCSDDSTVEICEEYADKAPIRILKNEMRKTTYALNMGIAEARGKYIIRLDAHADFAPDYIEKCVHYLESKPEIENVGGIAVTVGRGKMGSAIADMLSTKFGVGGSSFRTGGEGYVDTVPFGAFRKELFDKIGLFNHNLPRSEDNDINARIRAAGGKIWLAKDIEFTYYCRDTVPGILKMALQNGNALFRTLKENKKAMSIRHFIPFLFLLSLVVFPPLCFLHPVFFWIFMAELFCYLVLDFYFSFAGKSIKNGLITLWLYPLFHICYGAGSLLGLLGIKLY